MASRDKLGRWSGGASGNPAGRPRRGKSLTEAMEAYGRSKGEDGQTRRDALVAKIWQLALDGNLAAARLIFAYLEGLPVERVEAEGRTMAPFTSDEAAEAHRRLVAFNAELETRATRVGMDG